MNNHPGIYPKISLITPSLNQGSFIEKTIRSVLSQNYPNLEYIVVDGGSSDETLEILQRYPGQLRWISEKDKGQTDAINKGLRMATGDVDVVSYLNADDLLLPGTLFKIAHVFMQDRNVMWVTGQCRIINENDQEVRRLITAYKNLLLRLHHQSLLVITDYISQPATFWRADALRSLVELDDSFHYALDYEYWLRLNEKFPPVILHEYLALFRVHQHSKNMNAGHRDVYIDEERIAVQRYTRSKILLMLHDLHRWLMTTVYSMLNRR